MGDAEVKFSASTGDANIAEKGGNNRRYMGQNKRKLLIIVGVVFAVVVVVVAVGVVLGVLLIPSEKDHSDTKDPCGRPYSYPGVNISDLRPLIISQVEKCPLDGNCWTGEQCYECFKLPEYKVGNINNIPVCCPDCLISGLSISNSKCDCRGL